MSPFEAYEHAGDKLLRYYAEDADVEDLLDAYCLYQRASNFNPIITNKRLYAKTRLVVKIIKSIKSRSM